jgi:hypothetical protein
MCITIIISIYICIITIFLFIHIRNSENKKIEILNRVFMLRKALIDIHQLNLTDIEYKLTVNKIIKETLGKDKEFEV